MKNKMTKLMGNAETLPGCWVFKINDNHIARLAPSVIYQHRGNFIR